MIFDSKNVVDCVQEKIDEIAKSKWPEDYGNDLIFIVSRCFSGGKKREKLIITVRHAGYSYSGVLYPNPGNKYGLPTLEDIVVSLYNQTM